MTGIPFLWSFKVDQPKAGSAVCQLQIRSADMQLCAIRYVDAEQAAENVFVFNDVVSNPKLMPRIDLLDDCGIVR